MEIAIRLHDDEVRRRQGADTKAALYLAFLAAIIPVVGTLKISSIDEFEGMHMTLDVILFTFFILYISRAGWYSSQALATSSSVLICANDLSNALISKTPRASIANDLIEATRLNYPINNKKITYVTFTQKYIFRAFITLIIIVTVDWGSDAVRFFMKSTPDTSNAVPFRACTPFDTIPTHRNTPNDSRLQFHSIEPRSPPVCAHLFTSSN